jgi:hypothetical protein
VKKRILRIRKQSRIEVPKENLWYFSEDNVAQQSPVINRKKVRNDYLSIMKDDYDRFSINHPESSSDKDNCTFVVDWQLSDTF